MRSMIDLFFLAVSIGFILTLLGCADRPEVSPDAYGTILQYLPDIEEAKKPFSFPMEGDNDHQNCSFDDEMPPM